MDDIDRTLILSVASRESVAQRTIDALQGTPGGDRITFPDVELLWRVVTTKRLTILRALAGQGPLAIREIARRVGRDVKGVHGDVHVLLDAGVVDDTGHGIVLDARAVRVEFTLMAA